ncbi:flagellin N-terminal helical domain-containing protein [Brevundimonas aurantiaca]|jgi:flagellin|uniref:flagellin N-terminal helical domain-containing protein n=1 Tax=Brevundimonas aurantiaca TaxID=74316 RepID=UPI0035216ED8
MPSSIHTNRSALQAVQAVNSAGRDLKAAQNRISTGFKVGGAKDNGAIFAVASAMRAESGGWGVVATGLNRVQSITDVALMGAERISELLGELQQHAVALNDSLSGTARQAVIDQMTGMIAEIDRIARSTEFDGVNLLTGRPTTVTTTTTTYGLPPSTLPQPTFPQMAALPPGSFSSATSPVSYSLPVSPLTPPTFDAAVASISGSNSQTVVADAGATAGRVSLLLDAYGAPDVVEIWQNGVRVAASGQPSAPNGDPVAAGTAVTGPNVLSFDYDPAKGQALEFRFNEGLSVAGTAWTVGGLILQDPSEPPPTAVQTSTPTGTLQATAAFDPPLASANPEQVAVALDETPSGVATSYGFSAGAVAGRIDMVFDAFDIPDTVEVWQGGARIAASGRTYTPGGAAVGSGVPVTGQNVISFDYDPAKGPLDVRFNNAGADSDSAWVVGAISLSPFGSPMTTASAVASSFQSAGFGPLNLDVFTTPSGETMRVSSRDLTASGLGLDPMDFTDPKVTLGRVKNALNRATESSAYFGNRNISLGRAALFAVKSRDALDAGIGNLVDADLAKESAKLQAAQIRQELATQTLSIANGQPQWLLSLFRPD